jgi:hypothetical protein
MKPPKVIYLQWYGEDNLLDDDGNPFPMDEPDEIDESITWCADGIFDTDPKYILYSEYESLKEKYDSCCDRLCDEGVS